MKMLGNRSTGSADESQPDNKTTPPTASAGASNTGGFDDMDDDIPF
jgi:single-stranded DNA-binding protein